MKKWKRKISKKEQKNSGLGVVVNKTIFVKMAYFRKFAKHYSFLKANKNAHFR